MAYTRLNKARSQQNTRTNDGKQTTRYGRYENGIVQGDHRSMLVVIADEAGYDGLGFQADAGTPDDSYHVLNVFNDNGGYVDTLAVGGAMDAEHAITVASTQLDHLGGASLKLVSGQVIQMDSLSLGHSESLSVTPADTWSIDAISKLMDNPSQDRGFNPLITASELDYEASRVTFDDVEWSQHQWDGNEWTGGDGVVSHGGRDSNLYLDMTRADTLNQLISQFDLADELAAIGATDEVSYDALMETKSRLGLLKDRLFNAMSRSAIGDISVTNVTETKPFKRGGVSNIAFIFNLSDGQTISIWFHSPDNTPAKLLPQDVMISWKWMLNKRDVTAVLSPKSGDNVALPALANRMLRLAAKNSKRFASTQARALKASEELEQAQADYDAKQATIVQLDTDIADLTAKIDAAMTAPKVVAPDNSDIDIINDGQSDGGYTADIDNYNITLKDGTILRFENIVKSSELLAKYGDKLLPMIMNRVSNVKELMIAKMGWDDLADMYEETGEDNDGLEKDGVEISVVFGENTTTSGNATYNKNHNITPYWTIGSFVYKDTLSYTDEQLANLLNDKASNAAIDSTPEPVVEIEQPKLSQVAEVDALAKLAPKKGEAVTADDPDAIEKLEAKLALLQATAKMYRDANRHVRNSNDAALKEMGFTDKSIESLKVPDDLKRVGFPDYLMNNNNGEIGRTKKRLKGLYAEREREAKANAGDLTSQPHEPMNEGETELVINELNNDFSTDNAFWDKTVSRIQDLSNDEFNRLSDALENANYHSENTVFRAKRSGLNTLISKAEIMLGVHQEVGSLSVPNRQRRDELADEIDSILNRGNEPDNTPVKGLTTERVQAENDARNIESVKSQAKQMGWKVVDIHTIKQTFKIPKYVTENSEYELLSGKTTITNPVMLLADETGKGAAASIWAAGKYGGYSKLDEYEVESVTALNDYILDYWERMNPNDGTDMFSNNATTPPPTIDSENEPAGEGKSAASKRVIEGKSNNAKTPKGTKIASNFALVDAKFLIASHTASGSKNPKYPQDLQPRDRARESSIAWVQKTSKSLDPESLGRTSRVDTGAPIAGDDLVIESGNGRTIAIKMAYKEGNAGEYREWLIENADMFGFTSNQVESFKQPVLIRIRKTEVNRAEFAVEANQDDKLSFTASERAKSDAKRITDGMLDLFNPSESGDLLAASNYNFVKTFLGSLGDTEAAQYTDSNGQPTQALAARMKAAVFSKAYDDDRLLEMMADQTNPDTQNMINALSLAAGKFVEAQANDRAKTQDITDGIVNAVEQSLNDKVKAAIVDASNILSNAKKNNQDVAEYVTQLGLFDDIDPATAELAVFLANNSRSAKKMAEYFKAMAGFVDNNAKQNQTFDIFGDPEPVALADVINHANQTTGGGNLFSEQNMEPVAPVVEPVSPPAAPNTQNDVGDLIKDELYRLESDGDWNVKDQLSKHDMTSDIWNASGGLIRALPDHSFNLISNLLNDNGFRDEDNFFRAKRAGDNNLMMLATQNIRAGNADKRNGVAISDANLVDRYDLSEKINAAFTDGYKNPLANNAREAGRSAPAPQDDTLTQRVNEIESAVNAENFDVTSIDADELISIVDQVKGNPELAARVSAITVAYQAKAVKAAMAAMALMSGGT